MKSKKISFLIISSLILLIVIGVSFYYVLQKNDAQQQGKLVFASTYNQGHLVDRIELITAQDKVVLHQENSYWKVANKGNYFADFDMMHLFLSSMNQSVYSVKLPSDNKSIKDQNLNNPLDQKDHSGMLIKTYIGNYLLDEVIVGNSVDGGKYYAVRVPDSKNIWLTNGTFSLPSQPEDWLLRSLVSIPSEAIESISVNDKEIHRFQSQGSFFDEEGRLVSTDILLNVLQSVNVFDVLPEEDFNGKVSFEKIDEFSVTTSYGLKFVFLFYTVEEDLWFEVRLETTSLPMTVVNNFIEENSFLYDGWYFKALPEQAFVFRNMLRR